MSEIEIPTGKMRYAINALDSELLEEYADLGFWLEVSEHNYLRLWFKEKGLDYFTRQATSKRIQAVAQKYLDELNGGEK